MIKLEKCQCVVCLLLTVANPTPRDIPHRPAGNAEIRHTRPPRLLRQRPPLAPPLRVHGSRHAHGSCGAGGLGGTGELRLRVRRTPSSTAAPASEDEVSARDVSGIVAPARRSGRPLQKQIELDRRGPESSIQLSVVTFSSPLLCDLPHRGAALQRVI